MYWHSVQNGENEEYNEQRQNNDLQTKSLNTKDSYRKFGLKRNYYAKMCLFLWIRKLAFFGARIYEPNEPEINFLIFVMI